MSDRIISNVSVLADFDTQGGQWFVRVVQDGQVKFEGWLGDSTSTRDQVVNAAIDLALNGSTPEERK